jgi:hypothetical protein
MNMAALKKSCLWGRTLVFCFFITQIGAAGVAFANGFFGIEPGIGIGAGTSVPLDSGIVLGATGGFELNPDFGLAITYQHSNLGVTGTHNSESVSQLFLEANAFSYLLLHGGIHLGDVITNSEGIASNDLGVGMHAGFDVRLNDRFTVGLAAYWTYVIETEDRHSLYSLVVPLKVWF